MLSGEDIYLLRTRIDNINHKIHQASQETGLTFMPYRVTNNDVEAGNLGFVTEVIDMEIKDDFYYQYPCDVTDARYYKELITDAIYELERAIRLRNEFIEDFRRAWERVKNHGEGVKVHYGLRSVYIRVPFEMICKNGIYMRGEPFETLEFNHGLTYEKRVFSLAMRQPFDIITPSRDNEVLLSYRWSPQGCVSFDNRSDYLGWKFTDYQKSGASRADLMCFCNDVRSFRFREKDIFPDSTAPL